ncbi:hypothetical protein ACFE04_012396 [Oxalis oulophora]
MAQLLLITIMSFIIISGVHSTKFTFTNNCVYTVWPGLLSNAGIAPLSTTGFALKQGESKIITPPSKWGGRFWGRTLCSEDPTTGKFSCATADCGSDKLECSGNGAIPPATLAEFTLDGSGGMDFFDVSLVDGYNLPMLVVPQGGTGQNCTNTGCVVDLNGACPSELKVLSDDGKEGVACKSACEAFGNPEYCCNGAYATPDTCKPSSYSMAFKNACPRAYSYAYDDKTSTFTCANADYSITFCPSPNTSQKSTQNNDSSSSNTDTETTDTINGTMVYEGAYDQSELSWSTCLHVSVSPSFAAFVSMTVATWQLLQLFL